MYDPGMHLTANVPPANTKLFCICRKAKSGKTQTWKERRKTKVLSNVLKFKVNDLNVL